MLAVASSKPAGYGSTVVVAHRLLGLVLAYRGSLDRGAVPFRASQPGVGRGGSAPIIPM